VEAIPTPKKEISKIQHLEIKTHTKLVGVDIRTTKPKVDKKPLVFV